MKQVKYLKSTSRITFFGLAFCLSFFNLTFAQDAGADAQADAQQEVATDAPVTAGADAAAGEALFKAALLDDQAGIVNSKQVQQGGVPFRHGDFLRHCSQTYLVGLAMDITALETGTGHPGHHRGAVHPPPKKSRYYIP